MHTPAALQALDARRSVPASELGEPGPDEATLLRMLQSAARVPDHGKLEPWRFVVIEGAGRERLAKAIRARAAETGQDPDKGALAFEQAPLAVAVVGVPKESEKAPAIEQALSTGAAALSLLNAALAAGWGASWLTGWPAYDRDFLAQALGLAPGEWLAGFVYIGTCETAPPERPRPDVPALVTWLDA